MSFINKYFCSYVNSYTRLSIILSIVVSLSSLMPAGNLFGILQSFILVIILGFLTALVIDESKHSIFHLKYFLSIFGLGLFLILIIGLLSNIVFYGIFHKTSLNHTSIILTQTVVLIVINIIIFIKHKNKALLMKFTSNLSPLHFVNLVYLIPLLLTIFGTNYLNNTSNNIITVIAFIFFGILIICYFVLPSKVRSHIYTPLFLYVLALSILLSTSLRGNGITGSDIQQEYFVFNLTHHIGYWSMSSFKDPYNACLSITLLPTYILELTRISQETVFRVVFQCFGALIPLTLYATLRPIKGTRFATVATIIFIAFPFFSTNLAMYNRQEIALFFFGLGIMCLINNRSLVINRILFIIFMISLVVSHYSSSYISILLLILCVFSEVIMFRIMKLRSTYKDLSVRKTSFLIVIVILFNFLWLSQITYSSTGAKNLAQNVINNISETFSSNFKSGDVSYFFLDRSVQANKFSDFLLLLKNNNSISDRQTIIQIQESKVPTTAIGNSIENITNIKSGNLVRIIKDSYAKIIQLLAVIGIIVMLFTKRKSNRNLIKYIPLSVASILILASIIFLPFLSYQYSLLRTFQQTLLVLGVPISVSIVFAADKFRKFSGLILGLLLSSYFMILSGTLPEIIGGYTPQLNLSNYGTLYDAYYTSTSEMISFKWVDRNLDIKSKSKVHMNQYAALKWRAQTLNTNVHSDDFLNIDTKDYVYLDQTNFLKNVNYVFFKGSWIIYKYPVESVSTNKNSIYTNGENNVYK